MTKYFKYTPKQKKQMLSKWLNSQKKYRTARLVAYILYALAVTVCIGCCIYISSQATDVGQSKALSFTAIGLLVGLVFGSIPLAIGQVVINKSKAEYGRPYNRMTKEFLCVDDAGIHFGYHNTQNKYTASMDVYQIKFEDLNGFRFDEEFNIISIMGCGELIAYDDYSLGRVNQNLSGRKFYSNSWYSFILAFEDQNEFIELLNSKTRQED